MDRKELTDYLLKGISGEDLDRVSMLYRKYLETPTEGRNVFLEEQRPEYSSLIREIDSVERQFGDAYRKQCNQSFGISEHESKVGYFLLQVRAVRLVTDPSYEMDNEILDRKTPE